MNKLQQEKDLFHYIADVVRDLVSNPDKSMAIAQHKREGDFSTQVDIDVENLIVEEIKKRFPKDQILAEENNTNTAIPEGRIWIIDPICGTSNLARGINNYCTNIVLTEKGKIIASCVIDHSQKDYFWSVGGNRIYVNEKVFQPNEKRFDTTLEVDFGSIASLKKEQKKKHNNFLKKLVLDNNFNIISLNSSLSFTYTAVGKVDGFLNSYNHPWDISAASFLIQQSGGVITDLSGNEWTVKSVGAIAGKNKEIHQELLNLYLES